MCVYECVVGAVCMCVCVCESAWASYLPTSYLGSAEMEDTYPTCNHEHPLTLYLGTRKTPVRIDVQALRGAIEGRRARGEARSGSVLSGSKTPDSSLRNLPLPSLASVFSSPAFVRSLLQVRNDVAGEM